MAVATMKYQGITGKLEIFSSITGELVYQTTTMDFDTANTIEKAFRKAEELAFKGAMAQAAHKLQSLSEELKSK